MADQEQLERLKRSVDKWNIWRRYNPEIKINLREVDFRNADLIGANLSGADLRNADFRKADLRIANLKEAYLSGANFSKARLRSAKFSRANLSEVDLSGADLSRANLDETNLSGANLSQANLNRADLSGADLSGANLNRAYLIAACLLGVNLSGADLSRANLIRVIFSFTNGYSANLSHAILKGAVFTTQEESDSAKSFLELATVNGLETIDFGDKSFLQAYLSEAFEYAHQPARNEAQIYPEFFEKALQNIKLLRSVIEKGNAPAELVQVVQTITQELIKHLDKHPKALYKLEPRQFEELIAEILASYGWEVQLTPATKDGGYDIYAIQKDISGVPSHWIIECKKYAADNKVGVDIVRSLYGVGAAMQGVNMMLATTSYFTKGVKEFKASKYDLDLRNYESVLEWVNTYQPNPNGKLYIKDNKLVVPGKK